MTETFQKFDDLDWHSGDAPNEIQAAVHIALVYHWLRSGDMLEGYRAIKRLEEKLSPTELFIKQSDGQLVSEGMSQEAVSFLSDYYSKTYLYVIGDQKIPGIEYDEHYEAPYNILDSWKNVNIAAKFLNGEYSKWQNNSKNSWRKLFKR